MVEDEDDIYNMLRKLDKEYLKWGITVNTDKTKYIAVGSESRDSISPQGVVKGVNTYEYLGAIITKEGTSDSEINSIGQGKQMTIQLNLLLWGSRIKPKNKIGNISNNSRK